MGVNENSEALSSGAEEDEEEEPRPDGTSAEEFNRMIDEVSGRISTDAYDDSDDWMNESIREDSEDETLPEGEMEMIFENEYIM